jgi:hypothetical protein
MGDSHHYCVLQSLFKSQMELAEPQLEPADDHLSQLRRNLKITWRIHQKLVPKAESNGMSTKGIDYHIDKILLPVTFKNCLCFLEFVKALDFVDIMLHILFWYRANIPRDKQNIPEASWGTWQEAHQSYSHFSRWCGNWLHHIWHPCFRLQIFILWGALPCSSPTHEINRICVDICRCSTHVRISTRLSFSKSECLPMAPDFWDPQWWNW